MEKICKNCKYYESYENFKSNTNEHYGRCNSEKLQYGDCNDEKEFIDMLFYEDYESYKAFIEVGERFGCIHWKESE